MMNLKTILNIFLFLILLSTITITTSTAEKTAETTLTVAVDPKHPLEKQTVTLTCKANEPIQKFFYMEILDDQKRVILFQYEENNTELRGPWAGRKDVKAAYLKWKFTLSVNFTATLSDNGKFICRMVKYKYPNDEQDPQAMTFLWIHRKPKVLSLSFSKGDHEWMRGPRTTFIEGDKVTIRCKASLGYPEAKVNIRTFGEINMTPKQSSKTIDEYRYNESVTEASVKVTHTENGKPFGCNVKNENGEETKEVEISVLYGARELDFPYNPQMKLLIGSQIECFAKGNPAPTINITALPVNITMNSISSSAAWGRASSFLPFSEGRKEIPENAAIGEYKIRCEAVNTINSRVYRIGRTVKVMVVAPANVAGSLLPVVIVLAVLLAVILIAFIIQCCRNRRQQETLMRTSSRLTELEYAQSLLKTHSSLNVKEDPHETEMQQSTTLPMRSPSTTDIQIAPGAPEPNNMIV